MDLALLLMYLMLLVLDSIVGHGFRDVFEDNDLSAEVPDALLTDLFVSFLTCLSLDLCEGEALALCCSVFPFVKNLQFCISSSMVDVTVVPFEQKLCVLTSGKVCVLSLQSRLPSFLM